jgi:hypothetical protein
MERTTKFVVGKKKRLCCCPFAYLLYQENLSQSVSYKIHGWGCRALWSSMTIMDILCGYRIWDQVHGDKNGRDLEMSSPSRETHFVGATLLWSGAPMPCSMNLLHKCPWTFKHLLPLCLNLLVLQMQFEWGVVVADHATLVCRPYHLSPYILAVPVISKMQRTCSSHEWTAKEPWVSRWFFSWVRMARLCIQIVTGYGRIHIWMFSSFSIHHHRMYAMYTSDMQLYLAH